MSKIKFTPNGAYVLLKVPQAYYDSKSSIIVNEATKKLKRTEYIQKGDKMEVVATGKDVSFVTIGDMVCIQARGMFDLEIDGVDEPCVMVRESEILGKF